MASILNADIAGGLKATGDTSGVLQIQAGSVTVANIASSGVNAGIQVAPYAAPAFRAYVSGSSATVFSNTTWTKITLNAKTFDTNSNFDATTNYRFTPKVAGYYQFNGCVQGTLASVGGSTYLVPFIYKNGSIYCFGGEIQPVNGNTMAVTTSALIYMNGTTDYAELYSGQNNGGTFTYQNQGQIYGNWFSGCLVRGA